MNPKHRRLYTGRCGELAVMAELQPRGCTVISPEVDVGKDLFVFRGEKRRATRIQVKAGNASPRKKEGHYSVQVKVPLEQLKAPGDLYYVFAIRFKGRWVDFIVISREQLDKLRLDDVGTEYFDKSDKKWHFKLTFSRGKKGLVCSKTSFEEYRNAWHLLPPLAAQAVEGGGQAGTAAPDTGPPARSAGQLAAMSELLDRGCNLAIPGVDTILAFQDDEPGITEIQVFTCSGVAGEEESAYTALLDVPLNPLKLPGDFYYVFAMRVQEHWADFLVISRAQLDMLRVNDVGTEYMNAADNTSYLRLAFSFGTEVTCSGQSFQRYRNAWTSLPPLRSRAAEVAILPLESEDLLPQEPATNLPSQQGAPAADEQTPPQA